MYAIVKADAEQGKALSIIPVLYEDAWAAQRDAEGLNNRRIANAPPDLRFVVVRCPLGGNPSSQSAPVKTPIPTTATLFEMLADPIGVGGSTPRPQRQASRANKHEPPGFLEMD